MKFVYNTSSASVGITEVSLYCNWVFFAAFLSRLFLPLGGSVCVCQQNSLNTIFSFRKENRALPSAHPEVQIFQQSPHLHLSVPLSIPSPPCRAPADRASLQPGRTQGGGIAAEDHFHRRKFDTFLLLRHFFFGCRLLTAASVI